MSKDELKKKVRALAKEANAAGIEEEAIILLSLVGVMTLGPNVTNAFSQHVAAFVDQLMRDTNNYKASKN